MFKAVMQRNMGGRTLVELAQARAAGRPLEDGGESDDTGTRKLRDRLSWAGDQACGEIGGQE
jgi:hypothetical protein